jgi:hypothetical protein
MDRSFLSDKKVIAASRDFVCVRLATYESTEEALVLKSYFVGRSGDLENTTFALLTPDAQRVGRAGRSPDFMFRDADELVEAMRKLSKEYEPRAAARRLPVVKNVRLALDVAACDSLPLALVVGQDEKERARIEEALAKAAWSPALQGAFVYALVADRKELAPITSAGVAQSGVLVVEPDAYGVSGKVLAFISASAPPAELEAALGKARTLFTAKPKDPQTHIREGRRQGVHWETEIPDTDPGPPGGPPPGGGPPPR